MSIALLTGCKHSTERLSSDTKTFNLKGVVVAKDPSRGELTLRHEAVPGFMEAMTMPYRLIFAEELSELHEGDVIRARLRVQQTADGDYINPWLDEIAVLAQSKPNFKPAMVYNVPAPGQVVPDFSLVNQDGKPIRLSQFHGKALLLTFIYTRCPLGDFCPRMTKYFAAIQSALRQDPAAQAKTELLSVSFDPAFDTPAVLRAYGSAYVGSQGFEHWQFAMADMQSTTEMEHFFNVGVTGKDEGLTHSLSTVLIGPSGKIAAWYPGNEWQPDEVVAKMKALVTAVGPQAKSVTPQLTQDSRSF